MSETEADEVVEKPRRRLRWWYVLVALALLGAGFGGNQHWLQGQLQARHDEAVLAIEAAGGFVAYIETERRVLASLPKPVVTAIPEGLSSRCRARLSTS